MIASLFHAPVKEGEQATGTATIGSSEAIMLGTLALKRRWVERRKKEGKPTDKPNLVMGYNVQVVSHSPLITPAEVLIIFTILVGWGTSLLLELLEQTGQLRSLSLVEVEEA